MTFHGMKQLQERDFLLTPCLDRDVWEGRAGRCHQPSLRYKAFPQLVGITAEIAIRRKAGTARCLRADTRGSKKRKKSGRIR